MKLISVIVPVYNTEKYIEKCVMSILNQTYKNLENNIINPLSNRNMVRSSQATDLYKNLSDQNASSLSSYINDLLADSQENTASMMNNLLAAYMQGYNVISDMQNQSLQTSAGNGTTTTNSSSNSNGLFCRKNCKYTGKSLKYVFRNINVMR